MGLSGLGQTARVPLVYSAMTFFAKSGIVP